MLPNKRNMCPENIGSLFLFPCSDVSEGRRLTSDPNEHIYGMRRMILCEFNMEQLIRIFQKNNLRMECIFEIDITVSRLNKTFKGYQSTLSDFNKSLKRGLSTSGPVIHDYFHWMRICNFVSPIIVLLYTQVKVDLERPPVEHIWPEMMGIILAVNAWMVPFLKTFRA